MIKLTERLKKVAQSVPTCITAADIGTDHAYIPVYLVQSGTAKSVIASDIVPGPAKIAQGNINSYGLQDKISVVVAEGLKGISDCEVIIISGMGGKMICDILAADHEKAKSAKALVLQPMTAVYELRKFLHQNGYAIVSEDLAKEENKLYNILLVREGTQRYDDDIHYHIGKDLIDKGHGLLKEYIEKKIRSFETAAANMVNSNAQFAFDKRKELLQLKNSFRKVGDSLGNGSGH